MSAFLLYKANCETARCQRHITWSHYCTCVVSITFNWPLIIVVKPLTCKRTYYTHIYFRICSNSSLRARYWVIAMNERCATDDSWRLAPIIVARYRLFSTIQQFRKHRDEGDRAGDFWGRYVCVFSQLLTLFHPWILPRVLDIFPTCPLIWSNTIAFAKAIQRSI